MNHHRASVRCLVAVCGVLLTLITFGPVHAQDMADFTFSGVPSASVASGAEFSITVQIASGSTEVNAAQVGLDFDPTVLQVVSVTGGNALPQFVSPTFDNGAGTIGFAGASFIGASSGTFDLATITFRGIGEGTTSLTHRTDTSNPPISEINGPPNGDDATGSRSQSGSIQVGAPLAVSLSWFLAERNGNAIDFRWQTATETGTAGFNLLAMTESGNIQLNDELIPSPAIDSVEPIDYEFATDTDAAAFYLQEREISGLLNEHGPFDLGMAYGMPISVGNVELTPVVWLPFVVLSMTRANHEPDTSDETEISVQDLDSNNTVPDDVDLTPTAWLPMILR